MGTDPNSLMVSTLKWARTSFAPSSTRASQPLWDVRELLQRSFEPMFRFCVYLFVLLPSGTLFHINFKILSFLAISLPALVRLMQKRRMTLMHMGVLLLTPVLLLFWVAESQFYGVDLRLAFSEYRDIAITLGTSWLVAVYIGEDETARQRYLRMVLHAEVAACVLKIGLLVFAVLEHIEVATLVTHLNEFTGVNLMGANFGPDSGLGRIQFTADGLIPLCIFLLMRYRQRLGIRTGSALIMFLLLSSSLVFTFSRYFWMFAAVAFVLGLVLGKRDRFYWLLLAVVSSVAIVALPTLIGIATLRFSVDVVSGSDDVREVQIPALQRYFSEAPLLGHGFGGHPPDVTRSDTLPYVYEVQLLALAGQEGALGLLLMAAFLSYYFFALAPWNRPWTGGLASAQMSTIILLGVWLLAGLFNPMLLTSAAAISYGVLKALGELGM